MPWFYRRFWFIVFFVFGISLTLIFKHTFREFLIFLFTFILAAFTFSSPTGILISILIERALRAPGRLLEVGVPYDCNTTFNVASDLGNHGACPKLRFTS